MSGVSKEQIEKAKEWDLLTYLQAYEPHELKRSGPNEYCTVTHDSLKISNGMWCWNSTGIGGKTALDYLIKVRGLPFVRAVETLCGNCPPPESERPKPKPRKPFELPKAASCPGAMVPYLQGRGIDAEIIAACMDAGILYESKKYQNCVFVGKDPRGVARFACLRGTRDNFKLDVESSDKRYNFCLASTNPSCTQLAVAESPIDALSLASLVKRSSGEWREYSYLSLGGTAPRALMQFLRDYPQITQVSLCLDNDNAGMLGIDAAERAIQNDPELSARIKLIYKNPPPTGFEKDYNEFLCAQVCAERGKVVQKSR